MKASLHFLMKILNDSKKLHAVANLSWSRQVLFLVMNIAFLVLQMPTPFVISFIVNGLASPGGFSAVLPLIVLAIVLMFGALIVGAWLRIDAARQTFDGRMRLRLYLLRELMQCHALGFPVKQIGELHSRFTQDMCIIQNLWPAGYVLAVRYILTIIIAVAALFYIDFALTLSIAIFLPVAIIGFRYFGKRLSELSVITQQQFGFSNGILLESISAAQLAIVTGSTDFHANRLHKSEQSLHNALMRSYRWSTLMEVSLGALPLIISAMIWVLGGADVHTGKHTAGDLISFSLVLSILYGPINNLLSLSSAVIVEGVSLSRLLELIQIKKIDIPELNYLPIFEKLQAPAYVELDSLSYERDGKYLFKELSIKIPPGNCAALRGANGSGKSTLMGLIYGSQPTSRSKIRIDGIPLSSFDMVACHQMFGFLPQDVMIFSDTLRNNIVLGRSVSDEFIEILCERLGMIEFLNQWPQQLDTLIEEGGRNVSGGERQRIGLLRTLAVSTPVLLLDEPERNLDGHVLQCLVTYLKEIKKSCTCLLVTHSDIFDEVIDQTINLHAPIGG